MPVYLLIYFLLLFVAAVLALLPGRYDRSLYFIAALLFSDLVEELIHFYTNKYIVYHLFVPVYYDLFACYFLANIPVKKVQTVLAWSLIVFPVLSLALSFFKTGFDQFPSYQINSISVLLILICLIALYAMNIEDETPIIRRPIFWISISTLIFYSSDFIVIGLRSYLSRYDKPLADSLNQTVQRGLNYLYYLLIIIGMLLCTRSAGKSSSPSS